MASPPVVIEFLGIPGAGKTTLASAVAEELRGRGYSCHLSLSDDPPRRRGLRARILHVKKIVWALAADPRLGSCLLVFVLRTRPRSLPRISRMGSFIRLMDGAFRRSRRGPERYVVLDQGLLQAIWSIALFGTPPPQSSLRALLRVLHARYPVGAVVVDVEPGLAWERLVTRPVAKSRIERAGRGDLMTALNTYAPYFREIATLWPGPVLTVTPDGRRPLREDVEGIVAFIEKGRGL